MPWWEGQYMVRASDSLEESTMNAVRGTIGS